MSETTGREALALALVRAWGFDEWESDEQRRDYEDQADGVLARIAAVLSDEATVEAAARAMFADEQCDRHQRQYVEANWNARLCEDDRVEYRSLTRAALAVVAERFGIEGEG